MPVAIGAVARDRWLELMRAALADVAPPADVPGELDRHFATATEAMRNRD